MVAFARHWRFSDRRIRTRLAVILVLPLLAIVVLAGLSLTTAAAVVSQAGRARAMVLLGGKAGDAVATLQRERAAAALVFAPMSGPEALDEFRRRLKMTDEAVARYHRQRRLADAPIGLSEPLGRVNGDLTDLQALRRQVLAVPDAVASAVAFRYRTLIADLLAFQAALPQVGLDPDIAGRIRANVALARATEALGLIQMATVRAMIAGQISPATQAEIVTADARFTEAIGEFRGLAPREWTARFNKVVAGPTVVTAERVQGIVARAQPGAPPKLDLDASEWVAVIGTRMMLMHDVARVFDAWVSQDVSKRRDDALRTMAGVIAGVGLGLAAMIGLGWAVAQSLARSLSGLRVAAENVAGVRLPALVARFSGESVGLAETDKLLALAAAPVPVRGSDEVGQVASAFNAVTAAAVRLAGEQAALRGGVRAIFYTLARRGRRRIDAVMAEIDQLQRDETDPDRLERLFRLDHAATGVRRLTAGLLVLSGGSAGVPRPHPMRLADVLRAAQGEIDQYERVNLGAVDADVRVHGEVAEEFIHLLAELLDNAARFSPPSTVVVVEAKRVGDRLFIQITDEGKGMTDEQLADAHERLANPRRIDHRAAERMGLAVVAAIAERLGVSVALRRVALGGTRVDLTIPPSAFMTAEGDELAVPPTWPIPATQAATAPVEPQIFQELQACWFGDADMAERHRMATAIDQAREPEVATAAGLPRRRRGRLVIPSLLDNVETGTLDASWARGEALSTEDVTAAAGSLGGLESTDPNEVVVGESSAEAPQPTRSSAAVDGSVADFAALGRPSGAPGGVVARVAPAAGCSVRRRDPEQMRRRLSGYERGLVAARRRHVSNPHPEEQHP